MNLKHHIYCKERRSGIERRKYAYDRHLPNRRSQRDRRSGKDRRESVVA